MSAEERWTNQEQWKNERGELEINDERDVTGKGEICHFKKCGAPAVTLYEIKKAGAVGHGFDVLFCADHDHEESAFELYREYSEESS